MVRMLDTSQVDMGPCSHAAARHPGHVLPNKRCLRSAGGPRADSHLHCTTGACAAALPLIGRWQPLSSAGHAVLTSYLHRGRNPPRTCSADRLGYSHKVETSTTCTWTHKLGPMRLLYLIRELGRQNTVRRMCMWALDRLNLDFGFRNGWQ